MSRHRVQLPLLAEAQLAQIEDTAYRLLDEVGIVLQHGRATEMLHGLGCRVEKGRVFIPPDVVRWGLDHVAGHNVFYSIDGSRSMPMGDGAIRFHNSGGPPFVFDFETGERRLATTQDLADMTRLLDALPNVDMVMPLFGPQDVPPEIINTVAFAVGLRNTRKPTASPAAENPDEVCYAVEMAAACAGGIEALRKGPNLIIAVSPVSPLTFTEKVTAAIIAIAEAGICFHSLPAPTLGATGPITLAGALAQQHAEVLASFIIAAAARPGLHVTYSSRIAPLDMRTAVSSWGGPEVGMAGACAVQLAHRINIPCDVYGLSTSSSRLDPQYAYERMANALVPALAGADIMSGVGGMESGLSASFEGAVIDDEMIGLMKHVVLGCEVSEETLAFEVMRQVILAGGAFLGEMHTVKQMRSGAIWLPGVSERAIRPADARGVVARAHDRVKSILATHRVPPLPDEVGRHLDEIVERARRELVAS
jgi:trimethylamine---corrinoid protein Co-methyltransferase